MAKLFACYAALPLMYGCAAARRKSVKVQGDYVILLHGLRRTHMSMKRVERNLARLGYKVINETFPSSKFSIEYLANEHLSGIIQARIHDRDRKVHFVTHSLGGIILRHYLKNHTVENIGRVVMLSPPNNGSEVADRFKDNFLYKSLTGPAGQQLGTEPESGPRLPGPVDFELGVIAGDLPLNPYFSYLIDGVNDGIVSVESAKIDGMSDFLVVRGSHPFIMQNKHVINQIIHFLENGEFHQEKDATSASNDIGQPSTDL